MWENPPDTTMRSPNQFDDSDVIRQSKFDLNDPRLFRVLGPMVPYNQLWYQGIGLDKDTGEPVQQARMLRLPINYPDFGWAAEPTIFDGLATVDKRWKAQNTKGAGKGNQKLRSIFDPRPIYVFPVFDRTDPLPTIRLLEVSWIVYDQIKKLQGKTHAVRKANLLHGPIWIADIAITKTEKDANFRGPKEFNITYTVESFTEGNTFTGKVPVNADREKLKDLWQNSVQYGIFVKEEWEAIQSYNMEEVKSRYRPMNQAEIADSLLKCPIAIDATDSNGNLILPHFHSVLPQLTSELGSEIQLLEEAASSSPSSPSQGYEPEPEDDSTLDPAMEVKPEPQKPAEEAQKPAEEAQQPAQEAPAAAPAADTQKPETAAEATPEQPAAAVPDWMK